MKKSASLLVLLLLLISACFVTSLFLFGISNVGASSSATWDKLYGGELDDEAATIVQADDGGYVIAGTTYSFGAGGTDFWLIKIDADGGVEWNCTYGGAGADVATAMIQTSDGGYALAGKTCSFGAGESDFWLIKVDSSGNLQWNRTYGEPTADGANSLIQTRDEGYAMVGYVMDNNNESKNVWFVKTDSIGNIQWNRKYGKESSWENGYSVIQTSDDGYALAGSTNAYSEDIAHDCWLIKIDSDGNMEWNQTYDGDGGFDDAYVLLQASDGGYTFAGNTGGFMGRNVWVVRIDSNGNTLWDTVWETPEPTQTNCLIQTSNGGYAVTGWSNALGGFNNFSSYMFLIKLDANGNMQWNSTYNALGDNTALFVVQTDDSGYALAGTTRSTDEGACYDIWFAKVDASGEIIPEFPSWFIIPLLITATLVAIIYKKAVTQHSNSTFILGA